MEIVSYKTAFEKLEAAIPFALLIGSISAVGAAFLGYLLSLSGDYDLNMLWWHQWLGIGVGVLGLICFFLKTKSNKTNAVIGQSILMVCLSIAGHMGGNLTHGETYLTEYAPWTEKKEKLPPPTSVDSAFVFQHVIQPFLEKKCISCHRDGKRKGELQMNTPEELLKGGKHGPVLVSGKMLESELYRRVNLSPKDEEFMPPDGKTPLTDEEVALLGWWIEKTNHSFDQKVGTVEVSDDIHKMIANQLNLDHGGHAAAQSDLPSIPIDSIKELSALGFTIRPVLGDYQLVDVTLNKLPKNVFASTKDRLDRLKSIKSQIIWLNLSGQEVQDEDLGFLQGLSNLQRLRLENNPISEKGFKGLESLNKLESLNLYNTKVTKEILKTVALLPNLKKVYLWQTEIKQEDISAFLIENPEKKLVFGPSK